MLHPSLSFSLMAREQNIQSKLRVTGMGMAGQKYHWQKCGCWHHHRQFWYSRGPWPRSCTARWSSNTRVPRGLWQKSIHHGAWGHSELGEMGCALRQFWTIFVLFLTGPKLFFLWSWVNSIHKINYLASFPPHFLLWISSIKYLFSSEQQPTNEIYDKI